MTIGSLQKLGHDYSRIVGYGKEGFILQCAQCLKKIYVDRQFVPVVDDGEDGKVTEGSK